jgi:DNA polymerase/3'-5' exonuclease PolX
VDAIAAAQVLSEIGYLLRQDPDEKFRAKAFSAAAWSLAVERPDLEALHGANELTTLEGVGAGIAKVLAEVLETGGSRYLDRLREQMKQPARDDESVLDFAQYRCPGWRSCKASRSTSSKTARSTCRTWSSSCSTS